MRKPLLLVATLLGLACAAPRRAAAPTSPARAEQPFTSVPSGAPSGTPEDQDGDGRPDAWVTRDDAGEVTRLAYDLDRDGAPDVVLAFEAGRLVRKELLHRVEGVPPTWSIYEGGELVRKERDTDGDGRTDVWERFEHGSLTRIERDTDGDGAPDRVEAAAATPDRS